jgi:hypothetical protein
MYTSWCAASRKRLRNTALRDKRRRDEIRDEEPGQTTTRKKERKTGWKIYGGSHQKALPRNFYIINR